MLSKLSSTIQDLVSGRVALLALVIFVAFMVREFSGGETLSGDSVFSAGVPDVSFYYTADRLYAMADSYGAEGRSRYIESARTFDTVWPLVYGFFLVTALSWLTRKLFPPDSAWHLANAAPLFGMFFDYAENVSVATVMALYPQPMNFFAHIAGFLTVIKWVLVGGPVLLVVGFSALALWRALSKSA